MFLCIRYLFEQISASAFLIHLFFYGGFYCMTKMNDEEDDGDGNDDDTGKMKTV